MDRTNLQIKYLTMGIGSLPASAIKAAMMPKRTSERGMRTTPENSIKYFYRQMWTDPELRAAILDIRHMDKVDGRVKRIHTKTSRAATKGGLILEMSKNTRIQKLWRSYVLRLELKNQQKLESDMGALMKEGNIYLQWLIGDDMKIHGAARMPSETMIPEVTPAGVFKDPMAAFTQYELYSGKKLATFPLYLIGRARLTPDSYDDQGSLGRPYLDATRSIWQKLTMTEEDMVIRRKTRAAQRKVHQLKNMSDEDAAAYQEKVESDIYDQNTDYFVKGDGDVKPLQGDASLDQIADVEYLLDTFFSGSPAPKGLFGYVGDLNRDILEDLKNDFFDELDALQDTLASVYEQGFRLELLLNGLNPDNYDMQVKFAERRTETPNQAADRALKLKAVGASAETVHRTAGLDPHMERKRKEQEAKDNYDPYPGEEGGHGPKVSITPGNAPKDESATNITNK